jgi:transposase InsO family protein
VIAGYCTQGDYTKVPADDKLDIIQFIQACPWPVKRSLQVLGLARSTFYDWLDRYRRHGFRGLVGLPRPPIMPENRLLEAERAQIIATAKSLPLEGYRKVASYVEREGVYVSRTTVYRILSRAGLLTTRKTKKKTAGERYVNEPRRPGELWATDISYIFVEGYGFFYLFSVLDTCSRYVIHWELRPTMTTEDAMQVVRAAVRKAGITAEHGLRLLHDNGTQFVSRKFKQFLKDLKIEQVRTAYRHPETNGRLERFHLTLKDATVRLQSYPTPDAARAGIEDFIYEYNSQRPHQALDYVTPASVHFGYANELRLRRQRNHEQARAYRIAENRNQTTPAA